MEPVLEELDEDECLRLISPGGVGRIAFTGRYGLSVFPVNYRVNQGSIVFRTAGDSPFGEDLRTGIQDAEYRVAFEIDHVDPDVREGWSVLIHGPAHHMDAYDPGTLAQDIGVDPWPGGIRDDIVRITPTRITGRRIRRAG
jgi:nitroimidazol reductase NimA-like FMN-containing flavoprotein (pyridoxamine 5'-phosphate oxidase superfamily)